MRPAPRANDVDDWRYAWRGVMRPRQYALKIRNRLDAREKHVMRMEIFKAPILRDDVVLAVVEVHEDAPGLIRKLLLHCFHEVRRDHVVIVEPRGNDVRRAVQSLPNFHTH